MAITIIIIIVNDYFSISQRFLRKSWCLIHKCLEWKEILPAEMAADFPDKTDVPKATGSEVLEVS